MYYFYDFCRWAMQEGYGACLIDEPQLIADMIREARNRITVYPFTVSVKIRIHKDIALVFICVKKSLYENM